LTLEAGTRLGPYEIVSLLGKGGMGEVYKARDTRLERDVAIKVLRSEWSGDPRFKERLEREAKKISQLQHHNVCTVHDVGSQDGVDYLVMEYLHGETVESRLRKGALPIPDVLKIGSQIAEAIEAAHRRGVVHRDLKPGNVMLTESGAKVLDFGLARDATLPGQSADTQAATLAAAITEEGSMVGTMPYMAPELLEGRAADARADVWALGCVLYEMATGERPFRGATRASLTTAIMGAEPEPVSRKRSLAPERLDWVVKRCLAKDPERRWHSARDISIELDAIAGQAATPSDSTSAAAVLAAASRRGPRWRRADASSRSRVGWLLAAAGASFSAEASGGSRAATASRSPFPRVRLTRLRFPSRR
jgi:serine/threonine protein kinase